MSLRISYWSGWLDPQMVAVSKEIHQLREHFTDSCQFALSHHQPLQLSWARRAFGVNLRAYPLVRLAIPVLEPLFDVSHVFTALDDWHFLNALGRRPIVLTLTQRGTPEVPELLDKVTLVAAESKQLARSAVEAGIPEERVTLVFPGVELGHFTAAPPPKKGPWKVLFASSPENETEIETKGVNLLIALAKAVPDCEVTILWRPFGPASTEALVGLRQRLPENVHIVEGRVDDIGAYFRQAHIIVAPFRTVGKPTPNSILEGLACGRPALVSSLVDIGTTLEECSAGIQFPAEPGDFISAFEELRTNYDRFQAAARPCAERHFSLQAMRGAYARIYESAASGKARLH